MHSLRPRWTLKTRGEIAPDGRRQTPPSAC